MGLQSRADLNGKLAKLRCYDETAQRWSLELSETKDRLRLKPECLKGPVQKALEEKALRDAAEAEAKQLADEEARQQAEAKRKADEEQARQRTAELQAKKEADAKKSETAKKAAADARKEEAAKKAASEAKKKAASNDKKRAAS